MRGNVTDLCSPWRRDVVSVDFFQFAPEGHPVNPQKFGRFCLVAGNGVQDGQDMLSLIVFEISRITGHGGCVQRQAVKPQGQMAGLDHRVAAKGLCIFNDIFQFTHISGIIIPTEDGQRFRGDGCNVPVCVRIPGKYMPNKQGDVVFALAQRRDMQRDDIETVVEILPETACLDLLLEIETG